MIDKSQAQMLAAIAVACRPNGAPRWDEAGVVAALAKVRHLSLPDVALAVIRAADSRDTRTPGVIANLASPCWKERDVMQRPPTVVRKAHEFCGICGDPLEAHRRHQDHEPEPNRKPERPAVDIHATVTGLKQLAATDQPEPKPEPEYQPSPNVDRLRHLKDAATTSEPPTEETEA